MAATLGYNICLKYQNKTFVGVTQDDLSISANFKDSVTKDDGGVKQSVVTSHTTTFKVAGIVQMTGSGTTKLYNDAIMALALSTSPISIQYVRADGTAKSGSAIVTGYSESSPADPDNDTTYSLDLELVGDLS